MGWGVGERSGALPEQGSLPDDLHYIEALLRAGREGVQAMRQKSAVIYARVSTAQQAAADLPIDGQIEQCHAKARDLDADVLRVFVDPGISGREEMRPGFQDAIAFCEEHGINYFVTWSTSRFSRDHVIAAIYKRRLEKRGTRVVYCTMDVDRETQGGFVLDGVMAIFDEAYSRQISADTRRSMMKNARAGFRNGGRAPFGYQAVPSPADPKRRILAALPAEAWLVGEIFKWSAADLGCRSIAGRLNASGYTMRGRRWCASTVQWLLRNPAMIGLACFNRRNHNGGGLKPESEWIQIKSHPPIIDAELWSVVQAKLSDGAPSAGSPHSTWLFTGLVRCGHCGGAMQIETAKGRSKRYSYYNCATWLGTRGCRMHRRQTPELEQWLIDTITLKVFTPEVLAGVAEELNLECGRWAAEKREKMRMIEAQLADANSRKARLFEILELRGREAPNLGDLTERLRVLNDTAKQLMAQLASLDAEKTPTFAAGEPQLAAVREILSEIVTDQSDVRRTRALLKHLIESVVIHSDRAEINYRTALLADNGKQLVHSPETWLPARPALGTAPGTRRVIFALPEKLRRAA